VVEGFCPKGAVKHCAKIFSGIINSMDKNLTDRIRFCFIGELFRYWFKDVQER
jgi:hypothetical protein